MSKKNILFFSRDYQSLFFPLLISDLYNGFHVTLTKNEKNNVLKKGGIVIGCLEEDFDNLNEYNTEFPYLSYSWGADRFLRNYKYQERLTIQNKIITFWVNILEKYKPIAIVNEPVVIEVSEILWIESKKRNIKYLSMAYFNFPNMFYWSPFPEKCTLRGFIENQEITNQNLLDAKNYLQEISNGLKPSYVMNLSKRYSLTRLKGILKNILIGLFYRIRIRNKTIRQICFGDPLLISLWNLKLYTLGILKSKSYDNVDDLPENAEFMFYPLHFEPEGVLNYGAYFFDNQNELINNILKCIGENRILIVKEHPQQPGFLLQKEYLNLKKRYSNLVFCRSEESSIKLINRSILMLTLGGTSGFEALALGKKVVNFGSVFYDAFEDVININSFQELYKYLRYNKEFPIKGDLVSYTARIFSILKKGDPHPNLNLISNQNINYITNAIEEQLV